MPQTLVLTLNFSNSLDLKGTIKDVGIIEGNMRPDLRLLGTSANIYTLVLIRKVE